MIIERIIPEEDYPPSYWHQHQEGNPPRVNHVYTVSDIFTTVVQTKALATNAAFDPDPAIQPVGDDVYNRHFRQLAPYEIALMSGYNIHRSDILPEGAERSFLRVVYEGF